jgi:hypothetical protein
MYGKRCSLVTNSTVRNFLLKNMQNTEDQFLINKNL